MTSVCGCSWAASSRPSAVPPSSSTRISAGPAGICRPNTGSCPESHPRQGHRRR
jgi:hypothetical protein